MVTFTLTSDWKISEASVQSDLALSALNNGSQKRLFN